MTTNKNILILLLSLITYLTYGQTENEWQPDSLYKNRKVKKIFVYENSPKDLSEIIEFDKTGKRLRVEKYDASYDKRSRKSKKIAMISFYIYDAEVRLTETVDSIIHFDNSYSINRTIYKYDSNKLSSEAYYKEKYEQPDYVTSYTYSPFKSLTISTKDTIITYHKIKEYDKDFYVNHFYGYYLESKLKEKQITIDGTTRTAQYSDQNDMQRFEDNKVIKNNFDENGKLLSSKIKSVFMNDRISEYELKYAYHKNGLLKSIRGYVPRYYEYEYYD